MADAIVYGMAESLLSDLTSHDVQGIASAIGVKKELKKLERTLSTINDVLKDADEQQLIHNHALKGWVKNIKKACYEADDVLDDFATEALRRDLRIRGNTFKKVWSFAYSIKSVSFRFKMSRRIKEIQENFGEIAADRNKFHLPTKVVDMGVLNRVREYTHSFVEESEVFGRDGDKNKIISLLSSGDEEFVVAIIGMGGLGKTTLAQLVYNDKVVNEIFEMKMWVGVYQDFDVKKILENIIKSATNNECPDLEMDQLGSRLQEQVKGKKFLLVLDDVWNEDAEKWDKVKFVISSGAKGSKVVLTTRSRRAASAMEAKPYNLKELSSGDCWSLFEKRAFAQGEEQPDPKLVMIGKAIVDNCHGVPLAAKTLGSLMRLKTKEHEWEAVRDSDIWSLPQNENDIMPTLRLSYYNLPLYLKQCFTFASFSKDYEKDDLIQLWIAYGFVSSSSEGSTSLEDLGNEYVKELLWRSFIQEPVHDKYDNLISFKVHDLVRNLARDVSGTEYFCLEEGRNGYDPEEIRYAKLHGCPDSEIKRALCSMPYLRGLSLKCSFPDAYLFSRLNCLRSLNLLLTSGSIPSSIGTLKHLRRFVLQSDDIHSVPKSITNLLNLQTFHLSFCPKLRTLPKDIGKMIKLRHIYLAEGAPMSHMPSGFKYLTSLQTLTVFFVGKGVGCKLNELGGLIHLKGKLTIKNLENVGDASDCAEVNLKEKRRLESVKFFWNDQEGDEEVSKERSVDVLENLKLHTDVRRLEIEGYMGSKFASWMMKPLFPKLVEVSVVKCRNVENFPPFSELPLLRDLFLKDMVALKSIEGRGGNGFLFLKKLTLEDLPNLESFGLEGNSKALSSLPSLVDLTIFGCPRLEYMPLLPSVERLEVNCCGEKLVQSLLMLPSLKKTAPTSSLTRLKYLEIKECGDLISLPENWLRVLISLEELVIENCSNLVSLEDEGFADSELVLTSLTIRELPKLVSLPQWIQNLTKLLTLYIRGCEGLIDEPHWIWELTSLRYLQIVGCQELKSLPDGMQSLTAIEVLFIGGCYNMMRWPNGFGSLVSLKHLLIGCTSNLPSLPEELQQLTTLRQLGIANCQTMLALPEWLLNFTSLQSFSIIGCNNLQCLPDWMHKLTALQVLLIYRCDELTSRCQKGTGVDWPNITHIPYIKLNEEYIQKAEA
ncbi:hypothetical protein ACHQM5_003154 [Ranunculus cassubicifolius]